MEERQAFPMVVVVSGDGLPLEARAELHQALALLRSGGGGLARAMGRLARLAGTASTPLLRGMGLTSHALQPAIESMMRRAFDLAIFRQRDTPGPGAWARSSGFRTAFTAAASGVAGGFAGLPGFLPDASFTTLLILRNIAAIARENGEDPRQEATRRACLEVFLLDAPQVASAPEGAGVRAEETGYFAARLMLQGGPMIAVARQAAARFGLVLSQKMGAQAVPLAGAAAGAVVNTAFLAHYRAVARAHFTIRRLERLHGEQAVRAAATEQRPPG